MTIAAIAGNVGTGASGVAGPSVSITILIDVAVGSELIALYSGDNLGSADGDNGDVVSVTDSSGNVWTKLAEHSNANGAAAAGVTCSLWICKVTSALVVADVDTIQFNLAANVVDKCGSARAFSVDAGSTLALDNTPSKTTSDASNDWTSDTISGLSSLNRLYLRGLSKEANSNLSHTASASFSKYTQARSRNNGLAVYTSGEWRINTSTGETSDPSLAVSGDTAAIFVALKEVSLTATGQIDATVGAATAAVAATSADPVYSATIAGTIGGAAAAVSATAADPVYTAAVAATVGAATAAVAATSDDPVYAATIAATIGAATASALATFNPPTFGATITALIGAAFADVGATFAPPVPRDPVDPWTKKHDDSNWGKMYDDSNWRA